MDIKELTQKTPHELRVLVASLRSQLAQARVAVLNRQVKKVTELRRLRRDVARALSVLGRQSSPNS